MDKCALIGLLKEEIKHLNRLTEELEDNSALCSPGTYDCSAAVNNIISHLQKVKKECARLYCSGQTEEFLSKFMSKKS